MSKLDEILDELDKEVFGRIVDRLKIKCVFEDRATEEQLARTKLIHVPRIGEELDLWNGTNYGRYRVVRVVRDFPESESSDSPEKAYLVVEEIPKR